MSAVKKSAKASLYIFSFFVLILIAGVVALYANMDSWAKQFTEQMASDALGVPVSIGDLTISLEEKKVVVSNISVANPKGYKKSEAIHIENVTIAADSFSKELLNFARVEVGGTTVNLEVGAQGTNLGDIKKYVDAKSASTTVQASQASGFEEEQIKVIVQKFALTKAQLNPSVTLLDRDLAFVTVPDIHLSGIGEKENGIIAQEAIEQVMAVVLQQFNKSANSAGFLEGLSLDALNDIGLSTVDVFKKNLKKSFDEDVDQLQQGVDSLKGLFK